MEKKYRSNGDLGVLILQTLLALSPLTVPNPPLSLSEPSVYEF